MKALQQQSKSQPLGNRIEASLQDSANTDLDSNNLRLESSTKVISSYIDPIESLDLCTACYDDTVCKGFLFPFS